MRRYRFSVTGTIVATLFLIIIANFPLDNNEPTKVLPPEITGKFQQTVKPENTKCPQGGETSTKTPQLGAEGFDLSKVTEYQGQPYIEINENVPFFAEEEITDKSFEYYSELDDLGRCGVAKACIGKEIMPSTEREGIGHIRPAGWHTVKYDNIDGLYLYNRCHLIGYQLAGENANEKNLITGTRYMNVEGMLPFENKVAEYVKKTKKHVMYRVTPVYDGDNLLANGVLIEAYSVEDKGKGVKFNVFVYNVQPGITIDYSTGKSEKTEK
ncbi:MAG: DNA/RNA non-specific endonuclease [Lachnospiraceae bacterium]|nr:DNA/RNA non-specific endonuclease [Lachnospiraceae bacterium]